LVYPLSSRRHLTVTISSSQTEPPLSRIEPTHSRWWLALTIFRPFLDLGLYRSARFVIASIAAFLYDSAFNSANFLTALMLQQVFLFTPFQAGIILAPGAVAMGLAGVAAGRLADVIDPHGPILLGLLLHAAAMYYFGLTSLEVSTLWFTFLVVW
jgi:MFS family permease